MILMKRAIINPMLFLMGGLTVISGFFLLVHYESHVIKGVHEVATFTLLVFSVMHIMLNKKPLMNTLNGHISLKIIVAIFMVGTVVMVMSGAFIAN